MGLMPGKVEISVIVMTYYHENYVAQALDSILGQHTNLNYEVLVGDDASQDSTPIIIQNYARRYPQLIYPIFREHNLGANKNYCDLLQRARGRYIAMLEGDDFWIDTGKLQWQWEFLEAHQEYIGCCGKCLVVDESGTPDYTKSPHFIKNKKVFSLEDLIVHWDMPAQTGTLMYRNIFRHTAAETYSILYKAHPIVGDKTLMLLLLSHGAIYCSNKVLSCYRFIIKENGHNWFSIHHSNPYWQYDGFMYPCRLEGWARKKLGLRQHLGNRKDYHFISFVQDLVKMPSLKRLWYLGEMIAKSHQPVKYCAFVIKALIEME